MSTSRRRAPSLLESFNFAFEGVIHVLRTQRNLRIHFAVAFAVLIAAVAVGVDRIELIALLISISFVLIAEMLNTALEAGIDVATTSFDPLAKLAKDIAAGAVRVCFRSQCGSSDNATSSAIRKVSDEIRNQWRESPTTFVIAIQPPNAMAACPEGRPPRSGVPLPV